MQIESDRVVWDTGHIVTRERVYRDRAGARKTWCYVERSGRGGAVVIVARTRATRSLVMIRQYRVPFGREVVELPAGLVDPGEEPGVAAARELEEETGYRGEIVAIGPPVSSSAGLTTEMYRLVWMVVDEEPAVLSRHEDSESIQVHLVSPTRAAAQLEDWVRAGEILDGKAYLALRELAGDPGR